MADIEIDYEGAREFRQQRLMDAFDRSIEIDGKLATFDVLHLAWANVEDIRARFYSARFGDSA